eukprot:Nitzschia sp. Nitz4//scaffold58_size112336//62208//63026//NITZ4_004038-RA/size112336-processed-gene-0.220-mRNA-1//-1//CDS//3329555004//1303//frame0
MVAKRIFFLGCILCLSNAIAAFGPAISLVVPRRSGTLSRGASAAISQQLSIEAIISQPSPSITTKSKFGMIGAFLQNTLLLYSSSIDRSPILTKSVTAGVIFGLSDFIAQRLEKPDRKFDSTRLYSSVLIGLLYFGPAAHYWYDLMAYMLPGRSLWDTLQKAFLGQVIFGPSFTCLFFAVSLLQGGTFSLRAWGKKIRNDLPGAWMAGTGFWPLVDLVSFSLVPVKLIPLFVNICSLVWTVYLSLVANRKLDAPTSSP